MSARSRVLNLVLLFAFLFGSQPAGAGSITLNDIADREITLPGPAERVVAIGPNSARLIAYFGATSRLVGIEGMDQQPPGGRAYALAHHAQYIELPVIGQGGPGRSLDPEAILRLRPDVVIANLLNRADAERLSRQVRRPVVMVSFGGDGVYHPDSVRRSVEIVGEVLGLSGRAHALIAFIEATKADLERRLALTEPNTQQSVYVGAISMRGQHGIASTQARFLPLTLLNTPSYADRLTQDTRHLFIDLEQLLIWNPQYIFIDTGGLPRVVEEVAQRPGFFERLQAFEKGRVFTLFPFNHYGSNIELALANAYFIGSVLYPQAFADVDPHEKLKDLAEFFLGPVDLAPLYREYEGFHALALNKAVLKTQMNGH